MKKPFPYAILIILAVGAVLAVAILQMNTSSPVHVGEQAPSGSKHEDAVPRGPHGGWLFSKDGFRMEVAIFERGIPPQFRVYPTDAGGNPIDLNEVQLVIELHRLDRLDTVRFHPSGNYLLGDQTIVEPHSFDIVLQAQWNGNDYEWRHSQIEARAELSEEAIKNAGIEVQAAGSATLKNILKLTGEIGLNEEKVVHIVPRLDALVKRVFKDLGDHVEEGEILAELESRELADAKINYLAVGKQSRLATDDLKREILIYENTKVMLDLLEQNLDLETIYSRLNQLVIGKSREQLLPAYAKLKLSKSVFQREKGLFEKGISSESEYLLALENYNSAEARYVALREKIAYDGQWSIRQKRRTDEMGQLNVQTANQKLLSLGLKRREIESFLNDQAHVFTQYELRSSLSGLVIKKHITTGEAVKKDDDIFLLADLSDVWVNVAIPVKDIKNVHLGIKTLIRSELLGIESSGRLTYLDSIVDPTTRVDTGRVVIPNPKGQWRPGTFVTVDLVLGERTVPIAVPREAVQTLRDWSVVFVKYGNVFEARPLDLGASDAQHWEVLDGLAQGEQFVVQNSFVVKAEIEKSSAVHDH